MVEQCPNLDIRYVAGAARRPCIYSQPGSGTIHDCSFCFRDSPAACDFCFPCHGRAGDLPLHCYTTCDGCGADDVEEACVVCGNPSNKRCSKCKVTKYCSTECQRRDYKEHKVNCTEAS